MRDLLKPRAPGSRVLGSVDFNNLKLVSRICISSKLPQVMLMQLIWETAFDNHQFSVTTGLEKARTRGCFA